ncbi:MAG TPA: hypothetical protein VGK73_29825, partial [Polyangiaceae bacterium]
MTSPTFVVKLADLERGTRELTTTIPEAWLKQALAETDAVPNGDGNLELDLQKGGSEVMVRGRARVTVTVPCVVTLEPLRLELAPEIFLLLKPAPDDPHQKRRPGTAKAQHN